MNLLTRTSRLFFLVSTSYPTCTAAELYRARKLHWLLLLLFGVLSTLLPAADFDEDGISDEIEAELLAQFAPVWRANDSSQRPPLPIEWYVRHCQLRWYNQEYNGSSNPGTRLGDTGNLQLSLPFLITYTFNQGYYRLGFKSGAWRNGNDSADRITWQRLQSEQRGVYGRVAPLDGRPIPGGTVLPGSQASCQERYLVQYFLFFGHNVTDHPDESAGPCGAFGNHEGDVIGVEFEVTRPAPRASFVERAVYHNHGRKIFVDSPAALRFEAGHPIVYLERESQEAVPWPGSCGFWPNSGVPPCVGTEEVFQGMEILDFRMGAECEDWQVVREHYGTHFGPNVPGFLVTSVVNLGEAGYPGPSLEAQFLDHYPGLFGDEAHDQVFICYLFGKRPIYQKSVTSPQGPSYQGKLWLRERYNAPRDTNWPGSKNQNLVHVNIAFNGVQSGTAANPFNSLPNALPVMANGGTILFAPGNTPWRGTLCQPVIFSVSGGAVTIGQ